MIIAEGKRIRIRDIDENDQGELFSVCDEKELRAMVNVIPMDRAIDVEGMRRLLSTSYDAYVITDKSRKEKIIGFLFLADFNDFKIKGVEKPIKIRCIIKPSLRGQGYGKEGIQTFMDYRFKTFPETVFVNKGRLSNVASIRILNSYMNSISLKHKKDKDVVYFVANAEIFYLKMQQQTKGDYNG